MIDWNSWCSCTSWLEGFLYDAGYNWINNTIEKAEIHLILQSGHIHSTTAVVLFRVIDVFLLLPVHCPANKIKEMHTKAGTLKKPNFVPIRSLITAWNLQPVTALSLPAFHTGSDTTSFLASHTLRPAPDIILKNAELLYSIGRILLTKDWKRFICVVYEVPEAISTDETSIIPFKKVKNQHVMPNLTSSEDPTSQQ